MNLFLLYLLLLKATLTTFSGMSSLPLVRADFVVRHRVLTDQQLSRAVAVSRMAPGPNGLYLVSVGYAVAGLPGATAAFVALVTPAFLIIVFLKFLGHNAEHPAAQRITQAVTLASAGLIATALIPLARSSIDGPFSLGVSIASFLVLIGTSIDTLWVVLIAAAAGLARKGLPWP